MLVRGHLEVSHVAPVLRGHIDELHGGGHEAPEGSQGRIRRRFAEVGRLAEKPGFEPGKEVKAPLTA